MIVGGWRKLLGSQTDHRRAKRGTLLASWVWAGGVGATFLPHTSVRLSDRLTRLSHVFPFVRPEAGH